MYLLLFVLKKKHQKIKLSRSPVGNLLRFQKNLLFFCGFLNVNTKREKQGRKKVTNKKKRGDEKKKSSKNIHKSLISQNNK